MPASFSAAVSGGGGGTSFGIVQTPSGTSPAAGVANDTLTLTSSDGSVSIEGDADTDTIDFTASDATKLPLAGGEMSGTVLMPKPFRYAFVNGANYWLLGIESWGGMTFGYSADGTSIAKYHLLFDANGSFEARNNGGVAQQWTSGGTVKILQPLQLESKIQVKSQTDGYIGQATLVAGTVTVSNASVTTNSKIFPVVSTPGGTQGFLSVSKNAGVGFTINSTSATETSVVDWLIVESN